MKAIVGTFNQKGLLCDCENGLWNRWIVCNCTRDMTRDTWHMTRLEELQLASNPTYIHCLCDTGVMCYQVTRGPAWQPVRDTWQTWHVQGLDIAMARTATRLNIQGVVWDSCPGPYPEVTLVRWEPRDTWQSYTCSHWTIAYPLYLSLLLVANFCSKNQRVSKYQHNLTKKTLWPSSCLCPPLPDARTGLRQTG